MQKFSKEKLEQVAGKSLYTTKTNSETINYSFQIFQRFLRSGNILELGPAEGLMTKKLIEYDSNLYVIEGSSVFAKELKNKFPTINIINSLFEEVDLEQKFDNIVLGHVLEHVEDPQFVLSKIKSWLKPDGIILCAVPNARSIHRQVAVEMGLMNSVFNMSQKDIHHGHMRIYTPELLKTEFLKSDLTILSFGGYWLKPLSDAQIESSWDNNMLEAFMKIGEVYPDIAAELYIIAKFNKK